MEILAPLVPHMVQGANGGPGALWVTCTPTHVTVYRAAFTKPEVGGHGGDLPLTRRVWQRQYDGFKVTLAWGDDLVGMPAAFIAGCLYAHLGTLPGALRPRE